MEFIITGIEFEYIRKNLSKFYTQFKYRNGNGLISKITGLSTKKIKEYLDSNKPVNSSILKLLITLPEGTANTDYIHTIMKSLPNSVSEDNIRKLRDFLLDKVGKPTKIVETPKMTPLINDMDINKKDIDEDISPVRIINYSDTMLKIRIHKNGDIEIHDVDGNGLNMLPKSERDKFIFIPAGYNGLERAIVTYGK